MKDKPKDEKPRGGQTLYTKEIGDRLLEEIAKGVPLNLVCARLPNMPKPRTVSDWKKSVPGFAADFAHARETGFDALASMLMEVAFDETKDWVLTKKGVVCNETALGRARLIIDTLFKLLSKWDYARYGDKLTIQGEIHTNTDQEGMREKLKRSPSLLLALEEMITDVRAELLAEESGTVDEEPKETDPDEPPFP